MCESLFSTKACRKFNSYIVCSFKDYVIKEELGKGGFGVVCRVQSKTDKNDYALKIVRLRDK